jgi:hypothetical protein
MKNLLFLPLMFVSILVSAQSMTLSTAINKAGKQRALINRMAKDYMAMGSGVRATEAEQDLDDCSSLFNENLRDLMTYAKQKEVKDLINNVNDQWQSFRSKIISAPDVEVSSNIINEANNLTLSCNNVVEKLISLNTSGKNMRLVNTCSRQRQNLQKIGMLYLAKAWGSENTNIDRELKETVTNFDNNLNILLSTKENTNEINTALAFQKSEWAFLKKSFSSETLKPGNIYSSTNLMNKEFDNLTALYEKVNVEGGAPATAESSSSTTVKAAAPVSKSPVGNRGAVDGKSAVVGN